MEPREIRARLRDSLRTAAPALLGGLTLLARRVQDGSSRVRTGDAVGRIPHALAALGLLTVGRFMRRLPVELDAATHETPLREVAYAAWTRTLNRVHLRFTIEVYSWFLAQGITPAQLDDTLKSVVKGTHDELGSLLVRTRREQP